ncbi:ABC transporter substrate-binding protein [Aquamicrobium ahrensii]|uniref:Spermidine/putrescine transport system substrate-binding protein n=1 Tax=Aquamicrobium ahrensii TaxID=469551 RepID=A0ABV2KKW2_9HYPH
MITRRQFSVGAASFAGATTLMGSGRSFAARNNQLNILCWEGYNSDDVLNPFRERHSGATIRAESGTSDPEMINRLRAGGLAQWDLINVNQAWARGVLHKENLIKPLNKERFLPYFEKMTPGFANPPYPMSFSDSGELMGMPQRYGSFCFVVNTDKISQDLAEDQGWNLFLDEAMKGRYGVLTWDNWNVMHLCLTAGFDPFKPASEENLAKYTEVSQQIMGNAKMMTDDLVAMNTALINGEIDCYFTGGVFSCSGARYDGQSQVRAITPRTGPVDGKGGIVWVEITSAVNNPELSDLAEDFLEFIQEPEIAALVASGGGTLNPITQMGNPEVMALFDEDQLSAMQVDTLSEELSRCMEFDEVPSYDELLAVYIKARRG